MVATGSPPPDLSGLRIEREAPGGGAARGGGAPRLLLLAIAILLVAGALAAGTHSFDWHSLDDSGRRAPPGIYLVRLRAEGVVESGRMVKWQ